MYRGCLEVFRGVLDMYKVVYTCVAGVHRYPYGNESVYKGVYYTGCESDTKHIASSHQRTESVALAAAFLSSCSASGVL